MAGTGGADVSRKELSRNANFIFCCAFATNGQAQELKKAINFEHNKRLKEEYYVLKSNEKIKHGTYKRINTVYRMVEEKGFYKNNLKDSTWTIFFSGTEHILAQGNYLNDKRSGLWNECTFANNTIFLSDKGNYKNGERVGSWQFFNKEGEVIKVYDYSLEKLYYLKPLPDTVKHTIVTENGLKRVRLDQAPTFIEDKFGNDYERKLAGGIRYPMEALKAGKQGKPIIAFFIDENGYPVDHYIEKRVGYGMDEEALRVTKQIKEKWLPGMLNGQPVKVKYIIPVVFSIR